MRIHTITIDTANPQKLAACWSEAFGIAVANDYGLVVQLASPPAVLPFQFQKIEDVPTQGNRVHVDLKTPDLDSETERLAGRCALPLNEPPERGPGHLNSCH